MIKIFLISLTIWAGASHALVFPMPPAGEDMVGDVQYAEALPNDNFYKISRRYGVGYYQLVEANPEVDPAHTPVGTRLVIPTAFILPAAERKGIVVNVAELRLYYYSADGKTVETYPIGIGREGWNTPLGVTKITEKTKNPTWIAPKSVREARRKEGVEIPAIVPPGVDNPLGGYRMRLAIPSGAYLIHGTNDPTGVGRRSSSGCFRLFPEDVETLFEKTPSGTPVRVINEPYKVGWFSGKLYLEAHLPLEEQQATYERSLTPMVKLITTAKGTKSVHINWDMANTVARTQNGIPDQIGVAQ